MPLPRLPPELAWRLPELRLEKARELSLVAETAALGNLGNGEVASCICERLTAGEETLIPDPLAQCMPGTAKQLM